MPRGWWNLKITGVDEDFNEKLTDADREHIAKSIKDGFTSGELIQSEEK